MVENTAKIQKIGLLALLVVVGSCFDLQGVWKVDKGQLITANAVTLHFKSSPFLPSFAFAQESAGQASPQQPKMKLPYLLTVNACKTLQYNYYVDERSIFLQLISIGHAVKDNCSDQQIDHLKQLLEETFFFDINRNKLMLKYPSESTSLKLSRKQLSFSMPQPKYGIFKFIDPQSQGEDKQAEQIYIGNSTIYSCNFQWKAEYTIFGKNQITVQNITNNCNQSDWNIGSLLSKAVFELPKSQGVAQLYDNNQKRIATKMVIGESNQQQVQKALTQLNAEKPTSQDNTANGSSNGSGQTKQPETQDSQSTDNQPSTSTSTDNQPSTSSTSSSRQPSPISQLLDDYSHISNGTCQCQPITEIQKLTPLKTEVLSSKWYLFSYNGTNKDITDLYYYYLIVKQDRLIYYGGCYVTWSPYVIKDNNISFTNVRRASKVNCVQPNRDQEMQGLLFNNAKHVNIKQEDPFQFMNFYDQNLKHVATFSNYNQDYPSTWP